MYRNIVYRMTKKPDSKLWDSIITLFTWDESGRPIEQNFEYKPYCYIEHPKGTELSYNGIAIKKEEFDTLWDLRKWKESHPSLRLYDSVSPERQFLYDYFGGQQETEDFTKYELRVQVLDIEVATEDESVDTLLKDINRPMNVVTIYDSYYKKYFCWVLLDKKWSMENNFIGNDKVEYRVFDDEEKFLIDHVNWRKHNYPDILTGWNVDFDIMYSISRIIKIFGNDWADKLSPVGSVRPTIKTKRQNGQNLEYDTFSIKGVSIIDYLFLYRDKYLQKQYSYKLGHVGEQELGLSKIHYEGSFKEFYRNNFNKFVEYNIRDVEIVVKLDEKLKYIYLTRKICNFGLCDYECITRSSPYIIGALMLECKKNNTHLYTGLSVKEELPDENFEGAFVYDVQPSIQTCGVTSFDLNSLYPNIMINLNISPETKLGKILGKDENEIEFNVGDKHYKCSHNKFNEIIKDRITISSNNILYVSPLKKKGIVPCFLERLYQSRKTTKKQMLGFKDKLTRLEKSSNEYKELDTKVAQLSGIEQAYKIFLNSVYGQMGSKLFPLYDIDNASSVTLSGQTIIKESINFITNYIRNMFNLDENESIVVNGDTDSIYINCSAITKKLLNTDNITQQSWTPENIDLICKFIDNNVTNAINDNCSKITKDKFNSPLKNVEFKRETFCSTGLFFAKKRYILNVKDDEGVKKDKWKYVGVDIKRNELPPMVKDCLEKVIKKSVIENWKNEDYINYVRQLWDNYEKSSPEEIAYMKSYRSIKDSTGFLRMGNKTTVMAKSSTYYNHLIEYLQLENKYDKIVVGDAIRYVYLKKHNKFNIEVIAWKADSTYPEEFNQLFHIDYEKMFINTVLTPLKRYVELRKWSSDPDYKNQYYCVLE